MGLWSMDLSERIEPVRLCRPWSRTCVPNWSSKSIRSSQPKPQTKIRSMKHNCMHVGDESLVMHGVLFKVQDRTTKLARSFLGPLLATPLISIIVFQTRSISIKSLRTEIWMRSEDTWLGDRMTGHHISSYVNTYMILFLCDSGLLTVK